MRGTVKLNEPSFSTGCDEARCRSGLDLDVGNALWSLTALYSLRFPSEELFETHSLHSPSKGRVRL